MFPSNEPVAPPAAPPPLPAPQAPKPDVTGEQADALNKKIELVERNIAGQIDKKLSEQVIPPPEHYEDLRAQAAASEAKIVKLEERGSAAAGEAEGVKAEAQASVNRKMELLERKIAGQIDDKISEQAIPPAKNFDDLCAKVAAFEAKIVRLEERDHAAAAAAEGFKAEAQAALRRVSELEREAAGARKMSEAFHLTLGQFRDEMAALRLQAGSTADIICGLNLPSLNNLSLSVSLLEGRLKNLEAELADGLKERFSVLDSAFADTARKAALAQETASGSARRVEKLEELAVRLPYMENRLASGEGKLEKIYDLEALAQSLKLSVEGMEKNFSAAIRDSASISAEHKKNSSDIDALSRQVKHLAALFNQLRTELAFLMPKRQESVGDQ